MLFVHPPPLYSNTLNPSYYCRGLKLKLKLKLI
jgi:hypothetical protein